jgi:hypothetical protein
MVKWSEEKVYTWYDKIILVFRKGVNFGGVRFSTGTTGIFERKSGCNTAGTEDFICLEI